MKHYLRLRSRVLGRQLAELGAVRLLLLGVLGLTAVGNGLVHLAAHAAAHWLLPLLLFLLVAGAHRRRTDLVFLHLTAPDFRRWLAVEYGMWGVLPAGVLLLFGHGGSALLTVGLPPLAAWVPPARARATRQRPRSWFRSVAFEWVSGFRRLGAWGWGLALLAAASWWHASTAGPAVALGIWLVLLTQVYNTPEPWPMLLPTLRSPGAWLRQRVGWGLLYVGLTAAPLLTVMALGPAGVGGSGALLGWGAVMLVMVILAKYAFYPHPTLVQLTQGGVLALGFLILGSNSAYLALLLAALIGLLVKSRQRLASYRND